jgi:hypothetical protein
VEDAVLGPAVEIYNDRRQAWGSLTLYLAFVLLGIVGVFIGRGDLASGSATLGWAEVAGGVVLSLYSIRAVVAAAGRLRRPAALVVGRDGFKYAAGNGPVRWNEVEAVSDPDSPPHQPAMLRIQLIDPDDYVARHALSPVARMLLRAHHYDLFLGRDMLMPIGAVQALMRERLAESRQTQHAEAGKRTSARADTRVPRRRQSRRR